MNPTVALSGMSSMDSAFWWPSKIPAERIARDRTDRRLYRWEHGRRAGGRHDLPRSIRDIRKRSRRPYVRHRARCADGVRQTGAAIRFVAVDLPDVRIVRAGDQRGVVWPGGGVDTRIGGDDVGRDCRRDLRQRHEWNCLLGCRRRIDALVNWRGTE